LYTQVTNTFTNKFRSKFSNLVLLKFFLKISNSLRNFVYKEVTKSVRTAWLANEMHCGKDFSGTGKLHKRGVETFR